MLGSVGIYAAKKRKKPVQKLPKPPPPDGSKSNPSKRHRDRLNGELDKLTSLLPFADDVRARLDKLSVLRLSVGYLKVKNFFNVTMQKGSGTWPAVFSGNGKNTTTIDGVNFSEGDLLLQSLNGFVVVVTAEGYVFYSSPTIQDYLGFHQSDVVHQSVFELIHTDDRATFRRQLHFALKPNQTNADDEGDDSDITTTVVTYDPQHIPPENSSFLERNFVCRFRCLLDNSSGFLALNFQGRLKYLHGQNRLSEDGSVVHPQLALFAIGTPVQPPSIMEIRTKTLIFQTKHKLDFTPTGIDTRGKVVLGYTEMELCLRGSGYQFIHAADMMHCADNHIRMIKTGESGFTVFRLLTKTGCWVWVQANARLVYKGGRPDFIIVRSRALTNEEGEEHLRQRKMQLPFNFATGEGVLYDATPTLDLALDQSIYAQSPDGDAQFSLEKAFMDSHALLNVPGDTWPEGALKPHGGVKEESTVRAMIDSLEQIIGDRDFCSTLEELDPAELREWESALFRMNVKDSDMSVELHDILTNDIFSYVEEALCKEGGSDRLGAVATAGVVATAPPLPEFPGNALGDRDGILGDRAGGGQGLLPGTGSEVRGMRKLMHLGPQMFTQLPELCAQNGLVTFDPAGPCAQVSPQVRCGRPAAHSATVNGLPPCPQKRALASPHDAARQAPPPLQNQMGLPGLSGQPMAFQQHTSIGQSSAVPLGQESQWGPALPDAQFADGLLEFSLHSGPAHRLPSWQQHPQPPLPTATQNGHQPLPDCFGPAQGFQRAPPAGFLQNCRVRYAPQKTPGGVYQPGPQGALLAAPPPPTGKISSCMFERGNVAASMNGMHFSPSCPAQIPPDAQGPPQASCYYQSNASQPIVGSLAIPQSDTSASPPSCHLTPTFPPDALLPQTQFLSCSGQTQVPGHPGDGSGPFSFPPLTSETTYFTESNQTNCCDF
ncbi:hypothetical protein AAFF_G00208800 [Aldrovandia affinis]|uniref:Aryl hydrocarbon receptor n=1 Tax=Aldrovandia affinis TaxID=143900 RepID=A0AAD7W5Y6_9TELE|nr:hypothetical protein AAFF_G00208800 [Aldrovandia affinis]